jgi:lysophospholipid acyltransferase (LPLAT)-like uncharacterized protein
MKIRHPWLIKAVGFAAGWLLRVWMGTLNYRYRPQGPDYNPRLRNLPGRYIYAFWHENVLLPARHYGRRNIHALISRHADGQLIAEVCRHMGFRVVAGSSTRGGVEAVRQMLRLGRCSHLAITPDGPRGPRRQVQPGLVYLAARTGLAIVPAGIAYERAWRMRSWDRFGLPWPWSTAWCLTGEAIHVPSDADRETLERYRLRVQQRIDELQQQAEQWAGLGPAEPGCGQKAAA